jgi:RNA polymerase sigma-70 factor, ECF subfamily
LEQSFIQLIQQHSGIIHKVIRLYVIDSEDQRDLFQEVLLQAWKSYSTFQGKSAFSTWLYRIALNTVLTFRRKKQIFTESLEEKHESQQFNAAPEHNHEELLHTIRRLPEIDRIVLTLHLDAYENEEIASITGLSKNNVAVRLHRAKQQVIQQMQNQLKSQQT